MTVIQACCVERLPTVRLFAGYVFQNEMGQGDGAGVIPAATTATPAAAIVPTAPRVMQYLISQVWDTVCASNVSCYATENNFEHRFVSLTRSERVFVPGGSVDAGLDEVQSFLFSVENIGSEILEVDTRLSVDFHHHRTGKEENDFPWIFQVDAQGRRHQFIIQQSAGSVPLTTEQIQQIMSQQLQQQATQVTRLTNDHS